MITSRTFLTATSLCSAAFVPAHAQDLVFTHPSGATATFYGQFSPTFQSVDDGEESYSSVVDNSSSESIVGVLVEMPLQDNKLRFNLEVGLGLRNTADTNQIDDGDWIDWDRTDIRYLELSYETPYGTFWAGQGSMATDGASELDESGTTLAGYSYVPDFAGAYQFRDGNALSGIAIADAFDDLNGSRLFRLRYDTPSYQGFTFSIAYGEEILEKDDDATYYDTAINYSYSNDMASFDAAIGYAWKDDDGHDTEKLMASATAVHKPTGLNLTLSAGENQGEDGSFYYVKFGWIGEFLDYGSTAISMDYYDGSDFVSGGSSSESWGVQAVQTFDDLSLEAYLGYRVYSYDDRSAARYEDISALMMGVRWTF